MVWVDVGDDSCRERLSLCFIFMIRVNILCVLLILLSWDFAVESVVVEQTIHEICIFILKKKLLLS